jgi:membrane-bound serine protease (ClpP class)
MHRRMILWAALILMALFSLTNSTAQVTTQERPIVLRIQLANEAITPVTARYISTAIRQAEEQRAAALILVLDTPGGLVESTREVVRNILQSKVPVVVYVAPAGGRAASAGVFITMAGHVAAMAPGTNIGAAHPVQIGGLPGAPPQQPAEKPAEKKPAEGKPEDKSGGKPESTPDGKPESKKDESKEAARPATPMEEKIVNDTVAWARSLAELRGRNAEWITRAVKESISVTAAEAVKERAVDFVADDFNDLLAKLEGREVSLPQGKVILYTANADVQTREMWWGERMLAVLANPTLAFLLLLFGFYGILFELYTPGWGVGGTVGVICLVLGFFALSVLPINYVGLALIAIALALFVAEAFVTSFGFLTLGGVICLVLGGVMLVDSPAGFLRIPLWTILPVALATAAITFFLVGSIVKSQRAPLQTGSEMITGTEAIADETFASEGDHYAGLVRTHGELWKAQSKTPVSAGDELMVERRDGLTLFVRPAQPPAAVLPINKEQRRNIA